MKFLINVIIYNKYLVKILIIKSYRIYWLKIKILKKTPSLFKKGVYNLKIRINYFNRRLKNYLCPVKRSSYTPDQE